MKGIAKGKTAYFVVEYFQGITVLYCGSLTDCKTYCRTHGIPTKIVWDW